MSTASPRSPDFYGEVEAVEVVSDAVDMGMTFTSTASSPERGHHMRSHSTPSAVSGAFPRTRRPTEEVLCTIDTIFDLHHGSRKLRTHIHAVVTSLMECECPYQELSVFDCHLQALLGTLFSQVAEYCDGLPEEGAGEEAQVLGGLVTTSMVQDIISASRLSLRLYHAHCTTLRKKNVKRGNTLHIIRRGSTSSPIMMDQGRRLSCQDSCSSFGNKGVASTFVAAFTEGSLGSPPPLPSSPKRRPDTRIDRGQGNGSLCEGSVSHNLSPTLPSTRRASFSDALLLSRAASAAHLRPLGASHGSNPMNSAPELDAKLADLSTLQYFDIIVETIAIVLCVKYENQLHQLTHDGETAGAKRAAEWITARIVDELYNDGIDPSLPLCTQLILCAEGLALEDNQYVWRRASSVDPDVMAMVWGAQLPSDVVEGTLETKDKSRPWFEWGTFAQPGLRTPDGRLYTGPRLNPLQYGYRLGTVAMGEGLGLRNIENSPLRAPSFLSQRPGACLLNQSQGSFDTNHLAAPLPGLTLSAPPEGSAHRGGTHTKPHIRPRNWNDRLDLERKYLKKKKRQYDSEGSEYSEEDFDEYGQLHHFHWPDVNGDWRDGGADGYSAMQDGRRHDDTAGRKCCPCTVM
eukprot:Sspe_Gene.104017::Locus_79898_Transcript_1_3_Confidence_0.400_Length_2151::g.104017::m.104017